MAQNANLSSEFEAEQEDFVRLCNGLSDGQWALASLCSQWTVRQAVVHVAWHIHRSPGQVIGAVLATVSRGADKAAARQIARDETRSTQSLVEWLAAPGQCNLVNLGELLIHQQDIRRPLGLTRSIPAERLAPILAMSLTRGGSATLVPGANKRAAGLRFVATDMDWSVGNGAEVRGSGEALLMAINGRASAVVELDGPGASLLANRQPATKSPSSAPDDQNLKP
jgi:uncharacterized protein (TIGR03083 family)